VGRGIALLFLDLGARRGGWSAPRPGRFTPGKYPVPIVQEAGWTSGTITIIIIISSPGDTKHKRKALKNTTDKITKR
jgi:hypothetical protein